MTDQTGHSQTGQGGGKPVVALIIFALVLAGAVAALKLSPVPVGDLLDPVDGIWEVARAASAPTSETLRLATLDAPVEIRRDGRGVPHIFAESDRDATIALGWVVARDRLFQMEFLKRVATGRLAELLGEDAIETDRFFRSIGLPRAVRNNVAIHHRDQGRRVDILNWYAAGANAWIDGLGPSDIPFEFRMLGATPERFDETNLYALLGYMAFDLSYRSQDVAYERARTRLGDASWNALYPRYSEWEVPIIPDGLCDCPARPGESALSVVRSDIHPGRPDPLNTSEAKSGMMSKSASRLRNLNQVQDKPFSSLAEGLIEGKGSNNWAVNGSRSSTGMPILAGDMHLSLTLPAIWYEAHIVTPEMNVYGVTFPNAPSIVEGITPTTAWAFTNSGTDQLDTYRLASTPDRSAYRFDGEEVPFETEIDTIHVSGGEPVVDTLRVSRFGPVIQEDGELYAIRWVGHEFGRTFDAVWDMNHARNYEEFEDAIRQWDYPMQNILYAGADSTIAIRTTGHLPIRASGSGFGVLDGTSTADDWVGRVPFDELPHMINPAPGYATSTNQRPAGPWYPYYLGRDWGSIYRSIRIDSLLSGRPSHTPADLMRYQSDVRAVQADLFLPLVASVENLSPAASDVRDRLLAWDRVMSMESEDATLFYWFMDALDESLWNDGRFDGIPAPDEVRALEAGTRPLLADHLTGVAGGDGAGRLDSLLSSALTEAGGHAREGVPAWGDVHKVEFSHVTGAGVLSPLGRGPFPFPGMNETLSPGRGLTVSHSASWRVVVDFSTTPPRAWGVYPGGQSGNPFSSLYDAHLPAYLDFRYYPLSLTDDPDEVPLDAQSVGPEEVGR